VNSITRDINKDQGNVGERAVNKLEDKEVDALLLEVVLARAAGVAPWKRTLMIPLSRVDAGVSGQMAARGESL
jgi:hypothetical protein